MSGNILFDNILIADNEEIAEQWAAQGYDLKRDKIQTEAVSAYCCGCFVNSAGFMLLLDE